MADDDVLIHPTAIVSARAELAPDVRVGPYAVIEAGAQIGGGSEIGSHATISGAASIGRNNRVFAHAAVGGEPQDKKYAGEDTRLEIGNDNVIREFCTVNRGTVQDEGVTRIGDNNLLMAYVHIAHDCQLGNNIVLANCVALAGHVHMHDYVICSGFAGFHQFCRIGAHSFLGAGVKISRDIPPYLMVVGDPGEARGINSEGLRRRGFTPEQIRNLKEAYKLLYRSGMRLDEVRQQLAERVDEQPEIRNLVDFIEQSERGILR